LGIDPNGHDPTKNPSRPNGIYKKRKFRAAKKGNKYRENRGKFYGKKSKYSKTVALKFFGIFDPPTDFTPSKVETSLKG
jgi:hypothetical protein